MDLNLVDQYVAHLTRYRITENKAIIRNMLWEMRVKRVLGLFHAKPSFLDYQLRMQKHHNRTMRNRFSVSIKFHRLAKSATSGSYCTGNAVSDVGEGRDRLYAQGCLEPL